MCRNDIAGLCSVIGLAVACVLSFILLPESGAVNCCAAEPATVSDFRRDLSKIRAAAINVQGTFRAYRSETANLAALSQPPSEIGIPLVRSGTLWRNEKRFRADYKLSGQIETRQSVAIDEKRAYELTFGLEPDSGVLRVMSAETPEGDGSISAIKKNYFEPLDALWSLSGTALVDMLQRPDVTIEPNKFVAGGYGLFLSSDEVGKTRYQLEFEPSMHHPFGYGLLLHEDAGLQVKAERRVFSAESKGVLLPTRVVEVVTTGAPGEGYTTVVDFDLEPLEARSPVSLPIDPASFDNFGLSFQVYESNKGGKEELGERRRAPGADSAEKANELREGSRVRSWFLWINGSVILALCVVFAYMRSRRK